MMLLFPNEIFNLQKPADNQRIEQTFRKLVVLNVVGSNPTSHPKEILGKKITGDSLFFSHSVQDASSTTVFRICEKYLPKVRKIFIALPTEKPPLTFFELGLLFLPNRKVLVSGKSRIFA